MGRRRNVSEPSTMIFPLTFSALLLLLATPSLSQNSETGDFTTTSNKRLSNCCNRAAQICRNPCSGSECTAKCTVRLASLEVASATLLHVKLQIRLDVLQAVDPVGQLRVVRPDTQQSDQSVTKLMLDR